MSIFAWVDADLDGAGSSLVLSWLFKKPIQAKAITNRNIATEFAKWYTSNKDNYSKIFICDIDTSNYLDIVDHSNIVIIDHHDSHLLNKEKYNKANNLVKKYSSTTKLIYDTYKNALNLTKEQKLLINLIDDYDSNSKKYPISNDLNKVFWGLNGDRLEKFRGSFQNGFSGFDKYQKNIIYLYNKKLGEELAQIEPHIGNVVIGSSAKRIVSAITSFAINDISKILLEQYSADICIIINPRSETVSFRRSDRCNVSMNDLAKKLANGGGHKEAAGGHLTETFMNFCKTLQKI